MLSDLAGTSNTYCALICTDTLCATSTVQAVQAVTMCHGCSSRVFAACRRFRHGWHSRGTLANQPRVAPIGAVIDIRMPYASAGAATGGDGRISSGLMMTSGSSMTSLGTSE